MRRRNSSDRNRQLITQCIVASMCLVALMGGLTIPAGAQELRIDTELFEDRDKEPFSENLTLFHDGTIYDFRFEPGKTRSMEEVVVFRVSPNGVGTFWLLDLDRRVKLVLSAQSLMKLVDQVKHNEKLRAEQPQFIEPRFNEDWNPNTGRLALSSDHITYTATGTRTGNHSALEAYNGFANWYARLNAADPRKVPPFARLALNEAMYKRGIIPEQIELTLKTGEFIESAVHIKAKHYYVWTLSKSDLSMIDQVREMIASFPEIDLAGYYRLTQ